MLRPIPPVLSGALALGLSLGLGACNKDKSEPTDEPEAGGGPEVIVEQPGEPPAEPDPPDPGESPEEPSNDPPGGTKIVATSVPCQSDADCVKDSCCHATSCVAPADAPNCAQVMCTMDCQAGTMDCYGGCLCQDGSCAAEVWAGGPMP